MSKTEWIDPDPVRRAKWEAEEASNKTRQASYVERQESKGLTRVRVWVPVDQVERLKKYAARLAKEHDKD